MSSQTSYAALHGVVTKQEIHDKQRAGHPGMLKHGWLVIILCVALGIGLIRAWALAASAEQWLAVFLSNFTIAAAIGLGLWWIGVVVSEKAMERRIRFENFAHDNNLTYVAKEVDPEFEGIIFSSGHSRRLYDRFQSDDFEIGNYRYTVQHGKSSTTYKYGYIRIKLQRHVAHMLLDGKSNNTNIFGASLSNLPLTMNKDQTLSLEGDFNEHFTLYAPKEYERDALYIFTPDLMALLIDNVSKFDVEVIDDQLFVYGSEFHLVDENVWRRIFAIITNVGQKTISQTDYYADERVGDRSIDVVAEPGRRLRQGLSWQSIAFIVFFIISVAIQVMGWR
jgi:hypothetical protein